MLLWAAIAFLLSASIGRALNRTAFYRSLWHPALIELSIFVVLWAAIAAIPYHLAFSRAWPN
jgi:hypothetical protein